MSGRGSAGARGGSSPALPPRAKWWGLAAAAVVVLVVPIVFVANAVSDDRREHTGGAPHPAAAAVPDHPGWEPAWFDEFDGTALDAAKWMTCLSGYDTSRPCQGATDGEQQKYVPEQVTVADGSLHLTAERKAVDGLPFSSGAVSTGADPGRAFEDSRALFEPGVYLEARVRLARGVALWPAMWLMPMVPREPYRPEIDVFEFGGEQRLAQARLHAAGPCRAELGEVRGEDECYGELTRTGTYFTDDYHLFGIDWQADRLTYYADGEPVLTVVGDAVPRGRMYLIFNLAVGGIMGGATDHTPDRSTMSLDYVRAWRGSGQAPVGAANDGTSIGATATATATASATPPVSSPPAVPPSPSPPETPATTPATTAKPPSASRTSSAPKAPATTRAPAPPPPAPPPPAQTGEPWLEFVAPGDGSTVRGTITAKVRVNGNRDRVQEVSFYLNSRNCNSPKGDAIWVGYDRDDDNDGIYVYTFDTHRLSNGCNTISTVGIDADDEYRYYPDPGRVHLDVNVAN